MWWPYLQALHAFLAADDGLAGVALSYGTGGAVPEARTIELVRGPEQPDDLMCPRQGRLTIWIDTWAHDRDDVQALAGLTALEGALIAALDRWQRSGARVEDTVFRLAVSRRDPDGGIFRPTRGSRTHLQIDWRKG